MKNMQVSPQRIHAHGFSLLEMLLVLFLMALMASAGLMLTEGVEDQAKYDETKRRMELIRKAIVGDPTRTVNGSPEISGFVADMGRLPGCLAELLETGPEILPATDPRAFSSPCNATVTVTEWHIDADTGIASGWRGPYLQVMPERDGALRFRDGYGNSDATDAQNSGWIWQLYQADETFTNDADAAAIIRVQSFGVDGTQKYPAGVITDAEPANRPNPLIGKNDWQVQLPATVDVTFINQNTGDLPSSNQPLVLLIFDDDLTAPAGVSDVLTLNAGQAIAHGSTPMDFALPASQTIAIGRRGYVIACDKWDHDTNVGTPEIYTSFLGSSCSANEIAAADIRTFTVAPRQNISLDWIIK